MALQDEIDRKSATIYTEHLAMSIGELMNMYTGGELELRPQFQRFYRWDADQKSSFVESVLLGIPLPSIFVFTREDGRWEVIDGLQRLSTVLELAGLLTDEKGELLPQLTLRGTSYLPSLEGKQWEAKGSRGLTMTQRLTVKRAKLDVKVMKRKSDEIGKYELFQRLNTGGSSLSEQEVRNCILVMEDSESYEWLQSLVKYEPFQDCLSLSDRLIQEQYDAELVVRFLALRDAADTRLRSIRDLGPFLTESLIAIARSDARERAAHEKAFKATFDAVSAALGTDAFRRYDKQRRRFIGGFFVSAFEVLALGVGHAHTKKLKKLDVVAKEMWSHAEFRAAARSGVTASDRIKKTIPLGRKMVRA